jgi:ribonuclease G
MADESQKEEILINVTPSEVRAALLENGVLQEVYVERAACRGLISNIYKGRVMRVLPGMQAAFIDIGLERTAFLHASDIANVKPAEDPEHVPNIRELVREGDEIMVQVVKDPLGNKGARLTTYITLPSRHLVLLPRSNTVGVSAAGPSCGQWPKARTRTHWPLICAIPSSCGLSSMSSAASAA